MFLLPSLERGEKVLEIGPALVCVVPMHEGNAVLDHLFHGAIADELAVGIAPAAILGAQRAVRFRCAQGFIGQRHAAALADIPVGDAQQLVDGDAVIFGDELQRVDVGNGLAGIT